MVARNDDHETNARNNYYDDQARDECSSGGWSLPYFSLSDWAERLGALYGKYQYEAECRKAEQQHAAKQKEQKQGEEKNDAR